jgi:ABC-type lipoprotein export system ATPase subunit
VLITHEHEVARRAQRTIEIRDGRVRETQPGPRIDTAAWAPGPEDDR